jgi:hypothetical protein
MYALVLLLHSWLRWFVLIGLVVGIARFAGGLRAGRAWTPTDQRWLGIVTGLLDTQLLLGLLLYFVLSPITPSSLADFKSIMRVAPLRFFAVEHVTMMLLAVIAAHVLGARAKRASDDRTRFSRATWSFGLTLFLVLAGIPWPGLKYARPLFRV